MMPDKKDKSLMLFEKKNTWCKHAEAQDVLAQEAQDVIRKAFPCEGDLRIRHLWSTDGISRFRANWFREEDGKTMIVKSLFLCVTRATDRLIVQE
jgi:hypothetical protein